MPAVERPSNAFFEKIGTDQQAEAHRTWQSAYSKCRDVIDAGNAGQLVHILQRPEAGHKDLHLGLLYAYIAASENAETCLEALSSAPPEKKAACAGLLQALVGPHYCNLREAVRTQVVRLVGRVVAWGAGGADALCMCLLRHVQSGSTAGTSVWLAVGLVDIFEENFAWLCRFPTLLQCTLYMLLRTLPEAHKGAGAPPLETLKVRGSALAVRLLVERWEDCQGGGRDIVRALQEVSSMPEFAGVWQNLLAGRTPQGDEGSASVSGPNFNIGSVPLARILGRRTPAKLLLSRLTPEAEQHMYFILTQVRMGNQKRYQQWYVAKHLSGVNAEALVADLTRYICGVYHPPNHILSSDIIQRWAVLGWLLQIPRTFPGQANARLALLYDWFFFNAATDSIMNIEPAMLLMVQSIPRYAHITNQLLEFLLMAMDNLWPQQRGFLLTGVQASVARLCGLNVVRSLEPLVAAPDLAPNLRHTLRRLFPRFCGNAAQPGSERVEGGRPAQSLQSEPSRSTSVPHRTSSFDSEHGHSQSRSQSRSVSPAAESPVSSRPSAEPPDPGLDRKRRAEGPADGHTAKRPTPTPGRPQTAKVRSERPPADPWQVDIEAAVAALEEICGKGGSAERLQEGVGKVAETLAAGEKALARPGGRRKPQEVPDPDNEWKPLRVAVAGLLDLVRVCGGVDSTINWLPSPTVAHAEEKPLRETLGGALLLVAEEEEGNPKGAAAVRLSGALRCCEPTATLSSHLLRHACRPARAPTPKPSSKRTPDGNPPGEKDGAGDGGVDAMEEDQGKEGGEEGEEEGDQKEEDAGSLFRLYTAVCAAAEGVCGEAAESAQVLFEGMRLDAPIESQEHCLVADLRACLAWGPDAVPDLAPALLMGLPDLATGRPDVLYLLCALASPAHVLHMCADLAERRYSCCFPAEEGTEASQPKRKRLRDGSSAKGRRGNRASSVGPSGVDHGVRLLLAASTWDPQCQQNLWQLLVPEALALGPAFAAALALELLEALSPDRAKPPANGTAAAKAPRPSLLGGGSVRDSRHSATLLGLLGFLRAVPPTAELVAALLRVDASLEGFVGAALAAWQTLTMGLSQQAAACKGHTTEGVTAAARKNGRSTRSRAVRGAGLPPRAASGVKARRGRPRGAAAAKRAASEEPSESETEAAQPAPLQEVILRAVEARKEWAGALHGGDAGELRGRGVSEVWGLEREDEEEEDGDDE